VIELYTCVSVPHHNRSVIDAEEQSIARAVPFFGAFVRGELKNLDGMFVRVLEIERRNARRVLIPVGKSLWTGRSIFHFVLSQAGIRFVHVTDDDRDVLKPTVVTARIHWDRPAFRRQIFREFDEFVAEPHTYHAHSQSEHTFEMLVAVAGDFGVRYF